MTDAGNAPVSYTHLDVYKRQVLTHPEASNWISEAAQAEFGGINPAPELAPTQLAQPAMELRIVKVTD